MRLFHTWPAFPGVTAREWLGQDQQGPTSSPKVDNDTYGVEMIGGNQVHLRRRELRLCSFSTTK